MGSNKTPIFYKDKPLFGFDIGTGSVKVMQVDTEHHGKPVVSGYGTAFFDPKNVINEGEILNPETVAKSVLELFKNGLVGDISSHRMAISVPAAHTYTREMQLPKMPGKELHQAIVSEAEQYIPRPLDELYLDYTVNDSTTSEVSVYTVAVPRRIVDSYMLLSRILGLEAVLVEPSISASTRLLTLGDTDEPVPSVFIDFGTKSADISIFHKYVTVTGTVASGGDLFTDKIKEALGVTEREAALIKSKYGLGLSKKQTEIRAAVDPLLSQMNREIRRMIRYYEERSGEGKNKIDQVITTGGGANMPGLTDYLTEHLRLPTRMFDPWQVLDYGKLQPPNYAERSLYMTVAGLALAEPKEVFA